MISLGFATAILPDLKLTEILELAASIGFDCIEVMCWPVSKAERRYAGVTHIDVDQLTSASVSEIQHAVQSTGVAISGLGYYPNCLSPSADESQRSIEHLRKVIQAASEIGLSNVNTFIGRDFTKSVEENWPKFLDVWGPMIELAEQKGIRIGIENCPMLFSKDEWPGGKNLAVSPRIWSRMFRDIPSPNFGLNYDPSHMVWQQMDYLQPMREFHEKLFHLHAKDVRVDRHKLNEVGILAHPAEYHTPKLPGLGDIHWGNFFSVLTDVGYRGAICVEVEDRAYEHSLDARKNSLKQSHYFLRNYLPRA